MLKKVDTRPEQGSFDFEAETPPSPVVASQEKTAQNVEKRLQKFIEKIENFTFSIQEKSIERDSARKIRKLTLVAKEGDKKRGTYAVYIRGYHIGQRQHGYTEDDIVVFPVVESLVFDAIKKTDQSNGGARYVNGQGQNIEYFSYFMYIFGREVTGRIKKYVENAILHFNRDRK